MFSVIRAQSRHIDPMLDADQFMFADVHIYKVRVGGSFGRNAMAASAGPSCLFSIQETVANSREPRRSTDTFSDTPDAHDAITSRLASSLNCFSLDAFEPVGNLGSGTFSDVYLVRCTSGPKIGMR
eukprot:6182081-Pleurochrysis_carterae.AAC.1